MNREINLENYYNHQKILENQDNIKKIFFYRICGTGMGAAAICLREAGYHVAGMDLNFYPPMSDYLSQSEVQCFNQQEFKKEHLKDFDLIVVGNSVPRNSEDAVMIENSGLAFTSFPTLMGALVLKDKKVIGISGTHGKTTTTYLLVQLLESLGHECGYLIGGILPAMPPARIGSSPYFVIESDEYDSAYFEKYSKFLSYQIDYLVITSLEFDHADIFSSIDDIIDQFQKLIGNLHFPVVLNSSYQACEKLQIKERVTYGEQYPKILSENDCGSIFELKVAATVQKFETNVIGYHNILNLSACLLVLQQLSMSLEKLALVLKSLKFVKRRQEYRGHYGRSIVIDDFAHHPRAVELTIKAIKTKYPKEKITVVIEPASATARSSLFQKDFTVALLSADRVIFAQPKAVTSVSKIGNIDGAQIVRDLNSQAIPSHVVYDLQSLQQVIDEFDEVGNLFLILSNRTCLGLWESDFVKQLK